MASINQLGIKMTYTDLIQHYKTDVKIAAEVDVSYPTVRKWKKNGVPYITQLAFQTLTKGKLKASATPQGNEN